MTEPQAEVNNHPPQTQNINQNLNQPTPYHRELLKTRRLILSAAMPTKKARILYGGNISADIKCIQHMQKIDPVRANSLKLTFQQLYGLPFKFHEAILAAPIDVVDLCNILATTKILAPWAEERNREETAYVHEKMERLIITWMGMEKNGKGSYYLGTSFAIGTFEYVRHWYFSTSLTMGGGDGYDFGNSWDGFGLGLLLE